MSGDPQKTKKKKKASSKEPIEVVEEPEPVVEKKKASKKEKKSADRQPAKVDKASAQKRGEALIRAYFAANCAPTADLRLLESLVTDDVVVEYPSGTFKGKQAYLTHVAGTFKRLECAFHDSTVMWSESASDAAQIDVSLLSEDPQAREVLEISVIYLWRGHLSRWWWCLWCVPLCWPCVGAACCCCTCLRKQGRNTYRFRYDENGQLRICAIKTSRSTERSVVGEKR